MEAYVIDWLNLLARWLHLVTGIAWIGSSFYFIWLDDHLLVPVDKNAVGKGVSGEVWSVHGGGFYHAQKYRGAPDEMPAVLHWFKWEAYTTWLSGMFLLALVYWYSADVYLIDPGVASWSRPVAVAISIAFIVGGWLIYDALCRSPLRNNSKVFAAVLVLLISILAWGVCQVFSGRGAYLHFGIVLGTIMVANVYFVIIPGQKRMVAAAARGDVPNPIDGLRGKQRSVHNTYFTLPVLFTMTSNHFPMTYNHHYNWLILIGIALSGALIRVYFVARHKGSASPLPIIVAVLLLIAVVVAVAPRRSAASKLANVTIDDVRVVIEHRCVTCHSAMPTYPAFPAAPAGIILDTPRQIASLAEQIYQQAVVTRVMPIGNLTGMSDDERAVIEHWYTSRPAKDTH